MWGPLLEKTWSKIDANFLSSESGFTFQSMRAILGCPVAYYFNNLTQLSSADLWRTIRSQMLNNKYFFIASSTSDGTGDEEISLNECGLTNSHAFPILATFPLYNKYLPDRIDHMLYMLRDPRGQNSLTNPNTLFNPRDTESWIEHYRNQVPDGIDPLDLAYHQQSGVFFLNH